jgi:head-tail adaptor
MYGKTYTITVQETTESKNSIGEITDSWSSKGTVEGKIWMLSGNEKYKSSKDTRIIKYRLACDVPNFTINEDDRIVYEMTYAFYGTEPDVTDITRYDIEVVNDLDKLGKRYEIDLKEVD